MNGTDDSSDWTVVIWCSVALLIYFLVAWYMKVTTGRCDSEATLSGKVVVVTGANQGDLSLSAFFLSQT